MNIFYRILVAVYAFISTILCGIIMLSPFSDKTIMAAVLDYIDVTFYRSNQYDAMLFVFGIVFLALNVAVLTSGIKGKRDVYKRQAARSSIKSVTGSPFDCRYAALNGTPAAFCG